MFVVAAALASAGAAPAGPAPTASGMGVRPGLWQSVAVDARGRADPASIEESCIAETRWFAMAALTAGSREMGCAPLRPAAPAGHGAREICRQGRQTVIRHIRMTPRSPADRPLVAFDEVTQLRVAGRPGVETSRTRRRWIGRCPAPDGRLLGDDPR